MGYWSKYSSLDIWLFHAEGEFPYCMEVKKKGDAYIWEISCSEGAFLIDSGCSVSQAEAIAKCVFNANEILSAAKTKLSMTVKED